MTATDSATTVVLKGGVGRGRGRAQGGGLALPGQVYCSLVCHHWASGQQIGSPGQVSPRCLDKSL